MISSGEEGAAVVIARKLADAGKLDGFSKIFGTAVVGVEPVEIFNAQLSKNVPVAVAVVSIDTSYAVSEAGEVGIIYAETFIIMASVSFLLFFVFYRLTLKPYEVLNEDIDRILKGEIDQVTHEFKVEELHGLWDVINSAVQRIPKKGSLDGAQSQEEDLTADTYLTSIRSVGQISGAIVALLDGQGLVRYVNELFEEVTGIRFDSSQGQPLVQVARDQAFSAFVTDVLERTGTGTEAIQEDFEFSGVAYRFRVSAFGSAGGKARSYLWIGVKQE
jgi:PAS domain-containing protein